MKKILKNTFLVARMVIRARPLRTIGLVSLIAFLAGGIVFSHFVKNSYDDISSRNIPQRQKGAGYKFISPLLDCDSYGGPFALRTDEMKKGVEDVINQGENSKTLEHVSVYFRDLNNGPTMGINEEEEFTPASLLKVPIMIAYFKKAQDDMALLKEKIVFKVPFSTSISTQDIKPSEQLEKGKEYDVEELIGRMISYSDNESAGLLLENIDKNFLGKVYSDLGIDIPSDNSPENYMTVKEYAAFFRILYNSSYLNQQMSEKALDFLSRSDFNNGLKAGLPEGVPIAHKFGERILESSHQLHDCGIVYHSTPYILCVMSRGQNFSDLEKVIQSISRVVFREVDKK
jgi:beta-lactamase class A